MNSWHWKTGLACGSVLLLVVWALGLLDWLTPDWLSALTSVATLVVAVLALGTWREQLRGTASHATALDLATEVRALRNKFFEARSPLFEAWEFPSSYYEAPLPRSSHQEAEAWRHVYGNRWKELWPQILKLADMRPRVGAVLGDAVAHRTENLARKARELRFWMDHSIEIYRAGEGVAAWNDQAFVQRTRDSVVAGPDRDDTLSQEFTSIYNEIIEQLDEHL
jgi:hypothetical protein